MQLRYAHVSPGDIKMKVFLISFIWPQKKNEDSVQELIGVLLINGSFSLGEERFIWCYANSFSMCALVFCYWWGILILSKVTAFTPASGTKWARKIAVDGLKYYWNCNLSILIFYLFQWELAVSSNSLVTSLVDKWKGIVFSCVASTLIHGWKDRDNLELCLCCLCDQP